MLKKDQIRSIYDTICQKLRLDAESNPFDALEKHFAYKIKSSTEETKFEFTHPSYEEGLVLSWNRTEVKPFLIKVINELVKNENPVVRGSCGLTLVKNFADISFKEEAKRVIFAVLRDKSAVARYGVAQSIQYNLDEVPLDLAIDCFELMSHDRHRENRASIVSAVGRNYDRFPPEKALTVISQGLEDRAAYVRLTAVGEVRHNMDKLPNQIVLKAIEVCEDLSRNYKGWFISYFASITESSFRKEFEKLKNR